jgi:D-alanyl-D-alanine carboxypeptidase-like protein
MTVDLNDPRRADARGWGSGWPECDRSRWIELDVLSLKGRVVKLPAHKVRSQKGTLVFDEDVDFPGSVREEIRELLSLLLQVSERRQHINLQPGWCWGAGCRAIKRPDGTLTDTPSNHSWGLAVDINAPENVFGGSTHTIPEAMARLWNTYGFRWGGDYPATKDWMHFEFMGTPTDAKAMTEKARRELAGEVEELTPEQEKTIKRMATFLDTLTDTLGKRSGEPEPEDDVASPAGAAKRVATTVLKAEKT